MAVSELEPAAERLVDEVMPETLDWERLVRRYPAPALALATAGGFVLGWRHGPAIVAALLGFAGHQVAASVDALLAADPED